MAFGIYAAYSTDIYVPCMSNVIYDTYIVPTYMSFDIYSPCSTGIYATYMRNAIYVTYIVHIYVLIHAHVSGQYK